VSRLQLFIVAMVVTGAVAAIVVAGSRELARDRRALHAAFADGKQGRLDDAVVELTHDLDKIGADLELAVALAAEPQAGGVLERELHAIAATTREYIGLEVRDANGDVVVRSEAPEAQRNLVTGADGTARDVAASSRSAPGIVRTSPPLSFDPWLRVLARTDLLGGRTVTVTILVDTRPILAKLRLLRDPGSALLVLGVHGLAAPISDQHVVEALRALDAHPERRCLSRMMEAMRAARAVRVVCDEREALLLGLPAAAAVGVVASTPVENGEPWGVALLASTASLRSQEQAVVHRMVSAVALLGGVFLVLAAYLLRSARRSAAMRERLRHADRLAHLTEKAEKILDQIPSGVVALSADGRITGSNAWFRDRIGDAVGRTLGEALRDAAPADVQGLNALVDSALRTGVVQSRHGHDLSIVGPQARYRVHAVPLERRLPDVHALLVIEDLSPLQRLEDQLLHSEKLATVGILSAGIAHEIGTPLNIVRGRAELTLSRLGLDHPQAASQRVIIEQIDHVSGLIAQLLDFVRPRTAAVQHVSAERTLQGTISLLHAEAQRRAVSLRVEVEEHLPPLCADLGQLQQILVNLTMNALDACERGGTVSLRARRHDSGAVCLDVVDDGCGIPRAIRKQVFDPFFTTKKRGHGTGLGLSVVDQLVRGHGATIELDSEPGRGTTVRMIWPSYGEERAT
jgi:two-component system, NtrC family, sensor histidine kinase HydH